MKCTHTHTRRYHTYRVSWPQLSIKPAWHISTSLCPDEDFNDKEHEFVDAVAARMNAKATVPKVCIVFPMLCQTDKEGKVATILVKALVVVRV